MAPILDFRRIFVVIGLIASIGVTFGQLAENPGQNPEPDLEVRLNQMKEILEQLATKMDSLQEGQTSATSKLESVEAKLQSCAGPQLQSCADPQLTRIEASLNLLTSRTIVPRDCKDALQTLNKTESGVYRISPDGGLPFTVYCDQKMDGGGWTLVQGRYDGAVDFYRNWISYKRGFGDPMKEFWLGNNRIHRLTWNRNQTLRIRLKSQSGNVAFANYSEFAVTDEATKYRLKISGYLSGSTAGDAMSGNNGAPFSTRDQDHDSHTGKNCAVWRHAAWWYKSCGRSNLNGHYGTPSPSGIYWYPPGQELVLMKSTTMMVRTAD